MKYSIIIPCYNEAENLENLVSRIEPLAHEFNLEYILVENGSTDNSRYIFKNSPKLQQAWIRKVYININQGYGYGICQGLKASLGEYVGWIHADMQVQPEALKPFLYFLERNVFMTGELRKKQYKHYFLKGERKNRSLIDRFFTSGMGIFESLLFGCCLYDIGAIPVVFHRDLLNECVCIPNDFSIETYIYWIAIKEDYKVLRHPIILGNREKGKSSWNKGLLSKFKQSGRIVNDSLKIRRGEKVL